MIELNFHTPDSAIRDFLKSTPQSREEFEADFADLREKFTRTEMLSDRGLVSLSNALGSDGNYYDDVKFVMTSRYYVDNELYIAGSLFVLNVDKMYRDMVKIYNKVVAGKYDHLKES